jgi:hypothetical protein
MFTRSTHPFSLNPKLQKAAEKELGTKLPKDLTKLAKQIQNPQDAYDYAARNNCRLHTWDSIGGDGKGALVGHTTMTLSRGPNSDSDGANWWFQVVFTSGTPSEVAARVQHGGQKDLIQANVDDQGKLIPR